MIIAWTTLIVLVAVALCVAYDLYADYRNGAKEGTGVGIVTIAMIVITASIPAQYIFGG